MTIVLGQMHIFLCAIAAGAAVALLYDLLRIKRRAIKTNVIIVSLEDILYWLVSAIIIFLTVYNSNSGEIRGYIFMGNIAGVLIYLLLLSKIVISSSMAIINLFKKICRFIFIVLMYPVKIIVKILSIPFGFLFRLVRRIASKSKSSVRHQINKIKVWGRVLKNIRKKK